MIHFSFLPIPFNSRQPFYSKIRDDRLRCNVTGFTRLFLICISSGIILKTGILKIDMDKAQRATLGTEGERIGPDKEEI